MKRGFHWRKLWKRRWVALHGAEIVYMEKEPTVENSATMTITKAKISTATVVDRDDIDGNPNGFAIHVNDGTTPTWYLRAESAREKKSWLMRLAHVHAIVKWLEDFEKVRVLGVGGTGIVYELLHRSNGSRYAMKEMEIKNRTQMQMAVSEAEMLKDIMENVCHPNIMHIEKVFQVGSKFYLVFPLCTGGELYEHIIRRGHYTERDAAKITRDLVSALHALHQHDILHLDIKPENILFESMEPDAKIKITDFGLSKLYTSVREAQEKELFSMEVMQQKLKAFSESGELNRDRLRGTIGYMSPELILTGHCSKATDVFAAGVVLYILLCGRPPFNSKSNREVLEMTARGIYRITGSVWDEISDEAKDLVQKMLITNPEKRISTNDVLNHPFITQLDEEEDDVNFATAESVPVPDEPLKQQFSKMSLNKKKSNHLTATMRQLSGHVRQLRSEKLATSVTRLVSMIRHTSRPGGNNTLAQIYLIEKTGEGGSGRESTDSNVPVQTAEDEMDPLIFQGDFREALAIALNNLGFLNEEGKISIEQFMVILRVMHSAPVGQSVSMLPLLVCRFIDRDSDGFITLDDIAACSAMLAQRSESLLKMIFRAYLESVWYPGRQLNLMNLLQNTPMKGKNNVFRESSTTGSSSRQGSVDEVGHSNSTTTPSTNLSSSGGILSPASWPADVVEPPRFITGRHVAAVFERQGYDPTNGHKVFIVLCDAVARGKGEKSELALDYGLPENRRFHSNSGDALDLPPAPANPPPQHENSINGSSPDKANAALAAAFGMAQEEGSGNVPVGPLSTPGREVASPSGGNKKELKSEDPVDTRASVNMKMDFKDFCKAIELDDVLLQVCFRRPHGKAMSWMKTAQQAYQQQKGVISESQPAEDGITSANEDIPVVQSPAYLTAELIEKEIKEKMELLKSKEANIRMPVVNAVGATISAIYNSAVGNNSNQNLKQTSRDSDDDM